MTERKVGNIDETEQVSNPVVIEAVHSEEEIRDALENRGLRSLYQAVFAGPPYFERFSDADVDTLFTDYHKNGLVFLAKDAKEIIGFESSVPLSGLPDIQNDLRNADVDSINSWFIHELGVKDTHRGKGLARKLLQANTDALPKQTALLLQTHSKNVPAISLYQSEGFSIVPNCSRRVESDGAAGGRIVYNTIFLMKAGRKI